jgi:hypothetical protein
MLAALKHTHKNNKQAYGSEHPGLHGLAKISIYYTPGKIVFQYKTITVGENVAFK